MPPHRAPRNLDEILARAEDPRVDQPEAPTAIAPRAPMAQPNPEAGALLQAFQGFLQLQQ